MTARMKIPEPHRKLARLALALGWKLSRDGSGHLRWTSPDGSSLTTSSTPRGGRRTIENERARLRKAGLRLEAS